MVNQKNYKHKIQVFLSVKTIFFNNSAQQRLGGTEKIVSWKSQDLSVENLTTPTTTNNSFSP